MARKLILGAAGALILIWVGTELFLPRTLTDQQIANQVRDGLSVTDLRDYIGRVQVTSGVIVIEHAAPESLWNDIFRAVANSFRRDSYDLKLVTLVGSGNETAEALAGNLYAWVDGRLPASELRLR